MSGSCGVYGFHQLRELMGLAILAASEALNLFLDSRLDSGLK